MKKPDTLTKGINGKKHGEPNHHEQRDIGLDIPNPMKLVAFFVTLTAACMAAAAAWERGGTLLDKVLLVSMSATIVLAVHLLPALSRRWIVWPVWMGCLLCAMYGHLTFMIHASVHAEENRAQHSALTGTSHHFLQGRLWQHLWRRQFR